jgi:16S rRNA (guanine527-N7)-methyltransferase
VTEDDSPGAPPTSPTENEPGVLAELFADRVGAVRRYVERLVTDGVVRGLIGPREPSRIWTRHILNCAAVGEIFPHAARVVDVGSGAGLPGIVLALRRPDLHVDLVEPLARRVAFLREVVEDLRLAPTIRVLHGRAEDPTVVAAAGGAAWLTARAVAPLDRLARYCAALAAPEGQLAVLKGASVDEEVRRYRAAVTAAGWTDLAVTWCPTGLPGESVPIVRARAARLELSGQKESSGQKLPRRAQQTPARPARRRARTSRKDP